MSIFDNRMASSDLDTYRSDGVVQTRSVTFTGNVSGGSELVQTTSAFNLTDMDFYQILFDNNRTSSGKYRELTAEPQVWVLDTTSGAHFGVLMNPRISGNSLTIRCRLVNTTASTLTLQSTTINFRFVAFDSTLL